MFRKLILVTIIIFCFPANAAKETSNWCVEKLELPDSNSVVIDSVQTFKGLPLVMIKGKTSKVDNEWLTPQYFYDGNSIYRKDKPKLKRFITTPNGEVYAQHETQDFPDTLMKWNRLKGVFENVPAISQLQIWSITEFSWSEALGGLLISGTDEIIDRRNDKSKKVLYLLKDGQAEQIKFSLWVSGIYDIPALGKTFLTTENEHAIYSLNKEKVLVFHKKLNLPKKAYIWEIRHLKKPDRLIVIATSSFRAITAAHAFIGYFVAPIYKEQSGEWSFDLKQSENLIELQKNNFKPEFIDSNKSYYPAIDQHVLIARDRNVPESSTVISKIRNYFRTEKEGDRKFLALRGNTFVPLEGYETDGSYEQLSAISELPSRNSVSFINQDAMYLYDNEFNKTVIPYDSSANGIIKGLVDLESLGKTLIKTDKVWLELTKDNQITKFNYPEAFNTSSRWDLRENSEAGYAFIKTKKGLYTVNKKLEFKLIDEQVMDLKGYIYPAIYKYIPELDQLLIQAKNGFFKVNRCVGTN